MKQTPQYGFWPYNLGFLYEKMNRRKDAETEYRKAMAMMPNSPMPLNGLGTVMAAEGKKPKPKSSIAMLWPKTDVSRSAPQSRRSPGCEQRPPDRSNRAVAAESPDQSRLPRFTHQPRRTARAAFR